jgi:hypothetical protein
MEASLIVIQLEDGERLYVGSDKLTEIFADVGWYALERATFGKLLGPETRALELMDVTSDADDQFRYYRGNLVDVVSGWAVTAQPISWDVRWLR